MKNILKKLFLVNEIKSKQGILHFQRWRIIQTKWFSIFIHKIFESDKDVHLHNHPWDFSVFILSGGYVEELEFKNEVRRSFTFKKYNSKTFHKIKELLSTTTSLVFVGKRYREWGYLVDGKEIKKDVYRDLKNKNKL